MSEEKHANGRPFATVRPVFWALLVGTIVVALAIPTTLLFRATSAPLAAHAYVWPASPQVGETATLTVALPESMDRAAVQSPWAQVIAEWDMVTMAMGTHALTMPGSPRHPGVFTAPLPVTMAGTWWARVLVRTPGRPLWQTQLRFTVRPAGSPAGTSRAAGGARGTGAWTDVAAGRGGRAWQ